MDDFETLREQHTIALTTFRRDGTAVATPVSFVVDDDDAGSGVMRTWRTAGKAKRIRNNPSVTIAPSTVRGTPTGPTIPATARLLEGAEATAAKHRLRRKHPILHGLLVPLGH
jgi:PPOX class probable F420-dependent enzyme